MKKRSPAQNCELRWIFLAIAGLFCWGSVVAVVHADSASTSTSTSISTSTSQSVDALIGTTTEATKGALSSSDTIHASTTPLGNIHSSSNNDYRNDSLSQVSSPMSSSSGSSTGIASSTFSGSVNDQDFSGKVTSSIYDPDSLSPSLTGNLHLMSLILIIMGLFLISGISERIVTRMPANRVGSIEFPKEKIISKT